MKRKMRIKRRIKRWDDLEDEQQQQRVKLKFNGMKPNNL